MDDANRAPAIIRPLGQPGDLGWVVMAHGEVYADEFGWDTTFEALVARIVADYASHHNPVRQAAWMAEADGKRLGCVFCVPSDETTARLRILLVHPDGRGRGLGGRLVDTCMDFARAAGYSRMQLWTNDVLTAARQDRKRSWWQRAAIATLCRQDLSTFGSVLVPVILVGGVAVFPVHVVDVTRVRNPFMAAAVAVHMIPVILGSDVRVSRALIPVVVVAVMRVAIVEEVGMPLVGHCNVPATVSMRVVMPSMGFVNCAHRASVHPSRA